MVILRGSKGKEKDRRWQLVKTGHWGQWASEYALRRKADVAENKDEIYSPNKGRVQRRKGERGGRDVMDFLGQSGLLDCAAGRCLLRSSKAAAQ